MPTFYFKKSSSGKMNWIQGNLNRITIQGTGCYLPLNYKNLLPANKLYKTDLSSTEGGAPNPWPANASGLENTTVEEINTAFNLQLSP